MKRSALGRGISALIPEGPPARPGGLVEIAVEEVRPNPLQPRRSFGEESLAELAASIKSHGVLQPIIVTRAPEGGYHLIAGERRWRAARLAGLARVPALLREATGDADQLAVALIENLQREDLTPLEEAQALALLIERHGYTHRQVADLLGKSRPYVSNMLALTRLPESVKTDLQQEDRAVSRELLMGVARQETPEAALALWHRLQLNLLSVRRFRDETSEQRPGREAVADLLNAARRLNRALSRLAPDAVPPSEAPRVARVLRRTQRLAARQLAAMTPAAQPG
jgi:ParB family chromosome partitioning protein